MSKLIVAAVLAAGFGAGLAGCDSPASDTAAKPAAAAPEKLAAGEYEVSAKVTAIRSTDGKTMLVALKPGDTVTSRGCVDAAGTPAPELFAAAGDQCTSQNPYFGGGKINLTLSCTRPKVNGRIMVSVDGATTATGLKGGSTTTTFIDGPGDYELRTELTGRRVGACPPKA